MFFCAPFAQDEEEGRYLDPPLPRLCGGFFLSTLSTESPRLFKDAVAASAAPPPPGRLANETRAAARSILVRGDGVFMRSPRFYISMLVAMVMFIFLFVAYGVIRRHALVEYANDQEDDAHSVVMDYGMISYFLLVLAMIICAGALSLRATGPIHFETAFGVFALWLLYGAFSRRECLCCDIQIRNTFHNGTRERHHMDYIMDWMEERELCRQDSQWWIDTLHAAGVALCTWALYAVRRAESDYVFIETKARARLFYTQIHTEGADEELLLTGTSPHDGDEETPARRRRIQPRKSTSTAPKTTAIETKLVTCVDHARGEMFFAPCPPSHRRLAWARGLLLAIACVLWCIPSISNNPEHAAPSIYNARILVFVVMVVMRGIHAVARRRQCMLTFDAFDVIRNAASRAELVRYGVEERILGECNPETGRETYYPFWTNEAQDRIEAAVASLKRHHGTVTLSEESVSRWTCPRKRAMITRALAENWILQLCTDALIASSVLVAHPVILLFGAVHILIEALGYISSIRAMDAIFHYLYDITQE